MRLGLPILEGYLLGEMAAHHQLDLVALGHAPGAVHQAHDAAKHLGIGQAAHLLHLYREHFPTSDESAGVLAYRFTTWPDFVFEVTGDEHGMWRDSRFRRLTGDPREPFAGWQWLADEVVSTLGAPTEREDWFPMTTMAFKRRVPDGTERLMMGFDFGLLQRVSRRTADTG